MKWCAFLSPLPCFCTRSAHMSSSSMKIKNKNNAASSTKLNDPKNFRYNNSPLPTTKLQLQLQHHHHHHLLLFAFLSIIIIFFFTNFSIFTKLTKMSIAPKTTINQTFYISHGSPMLSIDDSLPARHFLKSWGDKFLDQKPNSILVISGHWETHEPTVTAVDRCDTIYDFYGFPAPMYKIKYPVPGAPDLAKRVQELLSASGFKRVHINKKRGLDHGAWVPLMLMYPEADIPVCQLSIQMNKDAAYHYNMGQALASLKEEGVLIIGSGSATHNLRDLNPNAGQEVVPWAAEFDKWLEEALISGRHDDVNNYLNKAPHARKAHPSPDHFYPLHVALGAAGESAKAELLHRSWELGTLSYASYKFTSLD